MRLFRQSRIEKIDGEKRTSVDDNIAEESLLRIRVNGKPVLSVMCSPTMIKELVTGLLFTEQIVTGNLCLDRMSIEYNDNIEVDVPAEGELRDAARIRTSGCIGGMTLERGNGGGTTDHRGELPRDRIIELFNKFHGSSEAYRLTGCLHNAAIASPEAIIVQAEDIGRHNAVDKVIGYCILENIPFNDKIIMVSGRLSSEMVSKCSYWKIPFIISRAAPTLMAVNMARASGATLIGFLRGKRFNIYAGSQRVL